MDLEVQDGRHLNHKPGTLTRSEEVNNVLTQALETNDTTLLDWCIESSDPPTDISLPHLAHLLNFLIGRYWVFSNPLCLNWIESLLKRFYPKIRNLEEFRPVLEDIKAKLKAKTKGIAGVERLRNKLLVATHVDRASRFNIESEPLLVVEDDD
jgi:hypothetical protein